jgi:hypothetical protein
MQTFCHRPNARNVATIETQKTREKRGNDRDTKENAGKLFFGRKLDARASSASSLPFEARRVQSLVSRLTDHDFCVNRLNIVKLPKKKKSQLVIAAQKPSSR